MGSESEPMTLHRGNPAIIGLNAPVSTTLTQRLGWSGTLRGRLGAVVDSDTLGYVTGGLALGHIRTFGTLTGASLTLTPAVDDVGDPILDANGNPINLSTVSPVVTIIDEWAYKVGWSAGAGVERHLGGSLTGRLEYLHLDFGKISGGATNLSFNSMPLTFTDNHRITNDIIRLGLNYKFDPAVAAGLIVSKGPIKAPIARPRSWARALCRPQCRLRLRQFDRDYCLHGCRRRYCAVCDAGHAQNRRRTLWRAGRLQLAGRRIARRS
jgi:hypothetical protein